MVDFDKWEISDRVYGGEACRKEGLISPSGEYWLIKYKSKSHGNNPVVEHICSNIFKTFSITVHETVLGHRRGKLVVGCKDFLRNGESLKEFREYKVSYYTEEYEDSTGDSVNLQEVLHCIRNHPILAQNDEVETRFWRMFVIDMLNGNADRNNGNWGFINNQLAPVYDNGNCLYFRFPEDRIRKLIPKELHNLALGDYVSRYDIRPFVKEINESGFHEAIAWLNENIRLEEILDIVDSVQVLYDTHKEFYREQYRIRRAWFKKHG